MYQLEHRCCLLEPEVECDQRGPPKAISTSALPTPALPTRTRSTALDNALTTRRRRHAGRRGAEQCLRHLNDRVVELCHTLQQLKELCARLLLDLPVSSLYKLQRQPTLTGARPHPQCPHPIGVGGVEFFGEVCDGLEEAAQHLHRAALPGVALLKLALL